MTRQAVILPSPQNSGFERLAMLDQAVLDVMPIGVCVLTADGRLSRYNAAAAAIWRESPGPGAPAGRYCGTLIPGEPDAAAGRTLLSTVLEADAPCHDAEVVIARGDGGRSVCRADAEPFHDDAGRVAGAVVCFQDITAEREAQARLQTSERAHRELLQALPAAVYTTDTAGRITFFNEAAVELAGRRPDPGDQWCVTWRLRTPDGDPLDHDQCPMAIALREKQPVRGVEAVAERPDGTQVPFLPFPTPLFDSAGELTGAVNMLVDISAAKQAEQRQKRLIDELNHRVKNTLATVQSIAAHTLRQSENPEQFRDAFEARLMALSRAHDLLNRSSWEGAGLSEIVAQALAPHLDRRGCDGPWESPVSLHGENLPMTPRAALSMAMVVHELAANATRYGALSTPGGRLTIDWRSADRTNPLVLTWRETGGPAPPGQRRRGFGWNLIERSLRHELGGKANFQFAPTGLTCTLNLSRTAVTAPSLQAAQA